MNHISRFSTPGKENKQWCLKKAAGKIILNLGFVPVFLDKSSHKCAEMTFYLKMSILY